MSEQQLTLFDLPIEPDEIGILLPPARLRSIDFSALEYPVAQRSIYEYIRTYFPSQFNDFVASNGVLMLADIMASCVAKLALRSDLVANDATLVTCTSEEAAINHLALINQRWRIQTPAVVAIEVSVASPLSTDLVIPPGMTFNVRGPNRSQVLYELYRAPGDFTSNVVVPAGKRGVIAHGVEGKFASPFTATSPGGPNQVITIQNSEILEDPLLVQVATGDDSVEWVVTFDPLERFGPNDKVVQARIYTDRAELLFGDNTTGRAPLAGQRVTVSYRVGGGSRGRIGTAAINETRSIAPAPPATALVEVLFRNVAPSVGGVDRETLDQVKRRAPRDFAVRAFASDRPASIVTPMDYAHVAGSFTHPHFGSIAKAVAALRSSINANQVELYVLAYGSGGLATPSPGLRRALRTYINEFNVATDDVLVLDGVTKPVDVDMTVVVAKNADATVVKTKVWDALNQYFDVSNWDMGQPLYVSDIVETVAKVDGVRYVDLFTPANNLLATNEFASAGSTGVGINEIVVPGLLDVKFFYEVPNRK